MIEVDNVETPSLGLYAIHCVHKNRSVESSCHTDFILPLKDTISLLCYGLLQGSLHTFSRCARKVAYVYQDRDQRLGN